MFGIFMLQDEKEELSMDQFIVLVTGGSGFLGQHVVKHLQMYGTNIKEVRVLDVVQYEQKLGL